MESTPLLGTGCTSRWKAFCPRCWHLSYVLAVLSFLELHTPGGLRQHESSPSVCGSETKVLAGLLTCRLQGRKVFGLCLACGGDPHSLVSTGLQPHHSSPCLCLPAVLSRVSVQLFLSFPKYIHESLALEPFSICCDLILTE